VNAEEAVQKIINQYNFRPSRKYKLETITEKETKTGGILWIYQTYKPLREIKLPRNPPSGYTSIYDLRDKEDFFQYFENRFPDLPDGRYCARTSAGGNNGMSTLFILDYSNGQVTNWIKKSNPKNKYKGYSARYYALPKYFRVRDDLNV